MRKALKQAHAAADVDVEPEIALNGDHLGG
jgi:hypothetical protein